MDEANAPAVQLPKPLTCPTSALAQEVQKVLKTKMVHNGGATDSLLETQAQLLDALFTHLILKNAATPNFNECFGLALALRAQKQCRATLKTMADIDQEKRI